MLLIDLSTQKELWLALFTDECEHGVPPRTEVSAENYSRVRIAVQDNLVHTRHYNRLNMLNRAELRFPEAGGQWGRIHSFGMFTASAGGRLVWWGKNYLPRPVDRGTVIALRAGDIFIPNVIG